MLTSLSLILKLLAFKLCLITLQSQLYYIQLIERKNIFIYCCFNGLFCHFVKPIDEVRPVNKYTESGPTETNEKDSIQKPKTVNRYIGSTSDNIFSTYSPLMLFS